MTTDGERVCLRRVTYDELWRKCVSLFSSFVEKFEESRNTFFLSSSEDEEEEEEEEGAKNDF